MDIHPQPVITNFSVQPGQINVGECVNVSWSTGGGTAVTRLFRDGTNIQDNAPVSGNIQDCLGNAGTVTYHDACSGLRELGIREQPRALLRSVDRLSLTELPDADICCGFGGTFCVKYPGISDKMLEKKLKHIHATGADTLIAGDLGCLMNMAGKLKRQGSAVKVRHVAEVLAGDHVTPPIAEAE
jgi:L-lactate dehydrogenase complex protein LldE